ncbi:MAG: DegT/DnrJ/EryC1/StrS family aminotransferase [Leptospirales bacterium]|nr:DegT/DnrJ/EryC1/StrS family aminotransferase [Leptospirales bacterium]
MPVPFIDLKRFESGFLERWSQKVADLSGAASFIGGAEVAALESRLAQECGVAHALACGNGTDALQLALRAGGVGPGDVVLLPDFTFWATFEAVVNVGASPVTVDVHPEERHMDLELFRRALDQYRPKAVLLVHLYGWGSPHISEFRAHCHERGTLLIEDGAQAYGVRFRGESIYRGATISTISFYPAKVLGAAGEAGAVLCNDEQLAARLRSMGNHGRSTHYSYDHVGWNSRMDALQAAFLNLSHEYLAARLESRRVAQRFYREAFADSGLHCVSPPADFLENGYLNLMVYSPADRARMEALLKEKGIGYGIVYPEPMSRQRGAQAWLKAHVGGEQALLQGQSVLSLPLFPYIRGEELEEVRDVVLAAR